MAQPFSPAMAGGMLSANNQERRGAEAAYRLALQANTEAVVQGLLSCLPAGAQPDPVRIIAAVLLRQLLDHSKEPWSRVSPNGRAATRAALLQLVFAEPTPVIANRIAHCVSQAAATPEPWPELLQTVCGAMGGGEAPARTALFVLEQLPEYSPELMHGNAMNLLPVYTGALAEANHIKVRVSALKATGALLMALDNDKERAPFAPLVQPMLAALAAALSSPQHEGDAQEVLSALCNVAQNAVDFFRAHLAAVVDAMLTVCGAGEQLEMTTRERALNLLITLCQQSPARMRRTPSVLKVVEVAFAFMCEIDADEDETREWMEGRYDDYIDDEEPYVTGDESMELVLEALGKALLPTVLSCIPPHVQHADWRRRRAAMATVGAAASGNPKALKPHVGECVRALLGGMADPHPRVKFAAVGALADLCDKLPGDFQRDFHGQALPALAAVVGDQTQCPRVRGHAASCVINFCNPQGGCETEHVAPHSDTLLGALVTCLGGGGSCTPEVMEEALGAVTRIAHVSNADFGRFYAAFMPGILGILATCSGPDQQRLRGKAMQCVGIIGTAVGVDMFRADALKVLEALMPAMQCGASGQFPDGYFEYYAPAAAQISHALKDQFAPFLPTVIPPLLHALDSSNSKNLFSATEVDAAAEAAAGVSGEGDTTTDEETGIATSVIKVAGGAMMRITLNTHLVMEKQMAAKTFYEYASALGVTLLDYLEAAAEKMLPLVIFKYNEDVRCSASFAVAKIFAAAVDAAKKGARPPAFASQLLMPFVDALLKGIQGEIHAEPRNCMSEALRDVLQACFESGGKGAPLGADGLPAPPSICLDAAMANTVAGALAKLATDSCGRRQEKSVAFEQSDELEEEDTERLEEELAEEEELMTNLVDCCGYLLKSLRGVAPDGSAAVAVFDRHVAPLFSQFMAANAPPTLRHNAICLFDDMIEFGGAGAQRYLPALVPVLVRGLDAEEPWERQACVYGIMQMAKHAPGQFASVYASVTPKLVAMVNAPDARDEEHAPTTDNCVSCLGAIARTPAAAPQEAAQLLQLQLAKLPLRADEVEAKAVHSQLCDLVEMGHPAITGNDFEQLPQVLAAFAAILESVEELKVDTDESLVDGRTRDRIVNLVNQFQAQLPGPRLQSAFSTLPDTHQGALQRAIQVGSS